ncbi:ATP-binding protein [Allosphingosinicella indica]|uniref:histidine kinase n=1 Tax=Allosphingosinicella indica TaxID=941907 RepID=A0A1X7FYW4_9SPHN|nr:ATP-binding protein [Allosphingosinicella indica]SMF61196.1 PAS domain S-box-containing protein [Allosphingosinicella indica]
MALLKVMGRKNLIWQVIALAVVPIFLAILTLLVSRGFAETEALRGDVIRSYESRSRLQRILSLHQDIETGQRGFALTSDRRFLEPYEAAGSALDRAFRGLSASELAGASAAADLSALRQASQRKRAFADDVVRLTQQGRADQARRLVGAGRGKGLMDEIRTVIARMDRHEQAQLAARTASVVEARDRLKSRSLSLQLMLVLLLALAAAIALRQARERNAALRRIEDLAARQEAIFDGAKDGMIVLNPSGGIESFNPAAARMFGYDDGDLQRRDVGILFDAAPDRGVVETFLKRLRARRGTASTEFQEFMGRRKDGAVFPAEVSISPVQLPDDVRFLAILRDISERKEVDRMKTEFVSTVSHELRTPLTSIAGSLGLVAGGAAGTVPPSVARLVEIARSNCARLIRLINDILDIEKIEAGRMTFDLRPLALAPLLAQAVEANKAYAAEQDATLFLGPVREDAVVLGDEDRLMQVLTNLLSNAAKFSPPGGAVRIAVTPNGTFWRVSITDEGPGIPEAFQSRIFTKFAQADSSDTRQKGGTGLGLSIVREIVARLGGSVQFETQAGQGTTFHVDLPPPVAARPAKVDEPLGRLDGKGLPLILHVDDDPDMLRVVAELFEGRGQVHSTPSMVEARASLRRYVFDAVILDIGMEDGNGLDLIPAVRENGDSAVIVFTAQETESPRLGEADAVLIKSRVALERLVEDVLRLARDGQATEGRM